MTRQLTKSAARYFAKDAYLLSVYNGIEQTGIKPALYGPLSISRSDGFYTITQSETGLSFTVKIARSWLY